MSGIDTEYIFRYIDLQITLRCNTKCLNCIEFCNMDNLTGLNYNDTDMSLEQIRYFIDNIKSVKTNGLKVSKYNRW